MKQLISSSIVFTALLTAANLPAQAANDVYSGSACQPLNNQSNSNLEITSPKGGIFNKSTSTTVSVICPVIQDETGSVRDAYGFVHVFNAGGTLKCSMHRVSRDGSTAVRTPVTMTTTGFSELFTSIGTTFPYGMIYITCDLPKAKGSNSSQKSGVLSYEVYEAEP